MSGSKDVELKSKTKTYARGFGQVNEHLWKLFNDKEFSDIEIECDREIFNCHQAILSTKSDVFRAIFQADMAENRTKNVTIKGGLISLTLPTRSYSSCALFSAKAPLQKRVLKSLSSLALFYHRRAKDIM